MPREPCFLFAGGGSGGHLSPGIAITERLRDLRPGVQCVFACSNRAVDAAMLREAGEPFVPMPAAPPSPRPRAVLRFIRGYRRTRALARDLLRERQVDEVVALGGFVAAPVVAAAVAEAVPVVLLNLDDPPGRANRHIARRLTRPVDRIWSAVALPSHPDFASHIVGMPVRRAALPDRPAPACREALGLQPDRPTLLITGASQGAGSINALMQHLAGHDPDLFHDWQVLHLAGQSGVDALRNAYGRAGVSAVVREFEHRMGVAWGAADLALSRAGASSVAEVAANAVPTLFLPYPHHADDHQRRNARPLEAIGGCAIERDHVDPRLNAAHVGRTLADLLHDAGRRDAMRAALESHRPPDTAAGIARALLTPAAPPSPPSPLPKSRVRPERAS